MAHNVYISIGSNQGDKVNNCYLAIQKLRTISLISKISSFYKTSSWGYNDDFYINFVIQIFTSYSPQKLLKKILFIEKEMGRIRKSKQYNSRIIDLDILFFDQIVFNQSNLIIPHPYFHLRKFVLIPLLEIAPDLICPQKKIKISDILNECNDQNSVEKISYQSNKK
tara:strand:- start:103 stop:603 length:501 start_codon:yes stop_codon:yes gene_type:complete